MSTTNLDIWNDVREAARGRLMDMVKATMLAQMGPDGAGFGDHTPSRGQRIARFEQDARSGALDILRVQSPTIYERYGREYRQDVMASPLGEG